MLDDPAEYLFEREYRKRQALIKACPSWVDREAIRRIYAESVRLSRQLGVGMKVIHVIPIRDRKASGLHIPENLKVVSQSYADLYRCNLDQENLHYQSSLSALTNVHRS